MRKLIAGFLTAFILLFTAVPAFAGTVNILEYTEAQNGDTKYQVQTLWDQTGTLVNSWSLHGDEWIQKKYASSYGDGEWALANYRLEGGAWILRDKFWCYASSGCTDGF